MSMLVADTHPTILTMRTRAAIAGWILSIGALLMGVPFAEGEVIWDATRKCAEFPKGSDQAIVLFRGRNAGDRPIAIVSADRACDCASANVETTEAKGERPCVVRVVLTRSAKHPNPASTIKVTTSDGANQTLTIDREGTPQVSVVPGLVWWKADSVAEQHEFIVQADRDTLPIVNLTAESTSENFTCDKERLDDYRWRIKVKPRSTAKAETATIRCEVTRSANGSKEGTCVVSAHLKIVRQ